MTMAAGLSDACMTSMRGALPAGVRAPMAVAIFAEPIAVMPWTRCECAADNLSARAMLAAGRTVPVRTTPFRWRLRRHGAIPMPALRLLSLRIANVARPFSAPYSDAFWHVTE